MIESFADSRTKFVYEGTCPKGFTTDIFKRSVVKLDQLNSAHSLDDLKIPPGNRLEALSGTRQGQHSIRINNQWRICFYWNNGNPHKVEITDYH